MNDVEILENMRDEIYGAMQFEDDYQVSELEEKEFNALNSAIKALKERQEDKERIKELEDIKNKAIGHIECCKTALGNYILSPSETEYLLHLLKGDK